MTILLYPNYILLSYHILYPEIISKLSLQQLHISNVFWHLFCYLQYVWSVRPCTALSCGLSLGVLTILRSLTTRVPPFLSPPTVLTIVALGFSLSFFSIWNVSNVQDSLTKGLETQVVALGTVSPKTNTCPYMKALSRFRSGWICTISAQIKSMPSIQRFVFNKTVWSMHFLR